MKVLGSIVITAQRQRTLVEGAIWDIPRNHIKAKTLARAKVGDLLWVKEPFVEFKSHRSCSKAIHEIARGASPLTVHVPDVVKPHIDRVHMRPWPAEALQRGDSMASLKILEIGSGSVRVAVRLQHVNELIRAWAP